MSWMLWVGGGGGVCVFVLGVSYIVLYSVFYTVKCWMKLFIISQILTVQQLKFDNGQVISSHTMLGIWLLIHASINVNTC